MGRIKPVYLSLLFFLLSCNLEERKAGALQREFFQQCPRPEFFVVTGTEGNTGDTLQLPLPVAVNDYQQLRALAHAFRPRLEEVDTTALSEAEKISWHMFVRLVDTIEARPHALNHPSRYAVDELLQHFIGRDKVVRHPGLMTALVESLPQYYALVEQRWQGGWPASARSTARRGVIALQLLDQLEGQINKYSAGYRERLAKALPPARYALKDYIAMCESMVLQ